MVRQASAAWDHGGAAFPLFGVGLEEPPRRFAPSIKVLERLRDDRCQQRVHRLKLFVGQGKNLYTLGDHVLRLVPFLAEVGCRVRTCRIGDESFEIIRQFLKFF